MLSVLTHCLCFFGNSVSQVADVIQFLLWNKLDKWQDFTLDLAQLSIDEIYDLKLLVSEHLPVFFEQL